MHVIILGTLGLWATVLSTAILSVVASPLHSIFRPTTRATIHIGDGPPPISVVARPYDMVDDWKAATNTKRNLPSTLGSLKKRAQVIVRPKLAIVDIKASIIPVPIAVQVLKAFYGSVMARALDEQWDPLPSSSLFTITEGAFQLTVSGLGGAVPMELLYNFGVKMFNYASKGMLPIYDIYYRDDATGFTVALALRILDANMPVFTHPKSLPRLIAAPVKNKRHPMPTRKTLDRRPSILTRKSLNKRNNNQFAPLNFHHLAMITPVNVVARYLEDFYDLIALKIETGLFNSVGPLHYVTFERWHFRLTFFSYAEAVPWDFIQNFAIDMSEKAAKGFTTSYDANFLAKKVTGDVFMTVTLRVVENAAEIGPGG